MSHMSCRGYKGSSVTQAEARAVTQDRERKLVIGGFSSKPGQTDAWVFASVGADKPLLHGARAPPRPHPPAQVLLFPG